MSFNPYGEWEEYQNIEGDFLRYLRNVPLVENHYDVWSFPLSNFLINIGSLVDSFFKNIAYEKSMNDVSGITELREKERNRLNMGDYRMVFEPNYQLSKAVVLERINFTPISPFAKWSSENRKPTTPEWWEAYTKLKHDRFQHNEKATLKNTLNALASLFLLNVKSLDTQPVLIDYQIINCGNRDDFVRNIMPQMEPINIGNPPVYAKTDLFGYVYQNIYGGIDDMARKLILSPSYSGFGY